MVVYKDNFLKRIELALKKKLKKYVSLNLNPIVITQPEDVFHLPDNCKILLLRQDRIGDVLFSVPTIRALRNKFPEGRIDIILSRKNHGVHKAINKYTNKIWIYDKEIISIFRLIRQLSKENYDIVIDMFDSSSTTSSFFTKYLRIPLIIGIDKENRSSYTHVVPLRDKRSVYVVERIANLLTAFGIYTSEIDLSLEYLIDKEDQKKAETRMGAKTKAVRLGINLLGSSKARFWGKENHIRFIRELLKRYNDVEIFLFSTLVFTGLSNDICKKTGARRAPLTSKVHDYASLLSTCDIIFTPDTAAVHFASAWKKPCIALYLLVSGEEPMPWHQYKSLRSTSGNLSDISVEEVIQAFEELIIDN